MHNTKHSRQDFSSSIQELRSQFEKSVQFLEQQDFDSSTDLAKKVSTGISAVIDRLIKDYPHSLGDIRFSKLGDMEATLDEYHKEKKTSSHVSDFTDVLVQLNKYIHLLETEVKHNYPVEPAWLKFLSLHRKRIVLSLLGLVLLSIPVGILQHFYSQRHGLRGQYYSKDTLSKLHRQRIDGVINFNWGMSSPFPKWKKDNFSVRWTGFLRVPEDGEYEFFTHSDDGVRLFLGDHEIISNWTNHNTTVNKVRLLMKKAYYPIRLEYYDNKRKAIIRLLWKQEGELRAVPIPAKYLVPSKELLKSDIAIIDKLDENPAPSDSVSEVNEDPVE